MDKGADSYRRYLDGEEDAFDEILNLYFYNLTFFINRYLHDPDASEDLAIDSFLELIIHPHRYHFKTPLKTYLFTIGRNKAVNYLKHRRCLQTIEWSEGTVEESDSTLEDLLLENERKHIIHEALAQLPESMQVAVHLVYFEELSYEDAARVMKKNKKQIDNLLYRAKAALRSIVEKEVLLL